MKFDFCYDYEGNGTWRRDPEKELEIRKQEY